MYHLLPVLYPYFYMALHLRMYTVFLRTPGLKVINLHTVSYLRLKLP